MLRKSALKALSLWSLKWNCMKIQHRSVHRRYESIYISIISTLRCFTSTTVLSLRTLLRTSLYLFSLKRWVNMEDFHKANNELCRGNIIRLLRLRAQPINCVILIVYLYNNEEMLRHTNSLWSYLSLLNHKLEIFVNGCNKLQSNNEK